MWVYHAAAQYLYPACMLAEATAFTATDVARNVHFGTWLGEGEVAGTQSYLGVGAEHLTRKGEKHLLKVGEAHALIYI